MKSYHDIVGDGGSRVLEQVAEQRRRITDGLAGVRHLVAVGSGKGGVGKSTLTLHLAGALRARGLRIAILDADFNGPSQARMAGVQGALFVPATALRGGAGGVVEAVVVLDHKARVRTVVTGIRDGDRVEIVSGLASGDAVVVDDPVGLADDVPVREGP